MRTVIVGASLAGLRVAEGLRAAGHPGEILLIGDEAHPPYDRPPLSKQVLLGAWDPARTFFRSPEELARNGIEHLSSTAAAGLRRASSGGVVTCSDGRVVTYDRLVIATGARARRLEGCRLSGVQTLRTLEDVQALALAFDRSPRVTIIGGGFIGAEVASAARRRNLETTILEALPAPLSRVLGQRVGEACGDLYTRHGVHVRCSVVVRDVVGDTQVAEVVLADGSRIPSDLVVVGIGAVPNTEWVRGSGLVVDDGIVCDQFGRAAEDVWAVGDVARWYHPLYDSHIRVEHWTHATEQAHQVARGIAGGAPYALTAVPYVWSDQFGVKVQIAGRPSAHAEFVVAAGDLSGGRFVGVYVDGGCVVGAVAFDNPRAIALARRLIGERAGLATALSRLSGQR